MSAAQHTPGPLVFCTDDAGWDRITIEQDRSALPPDEEPSVLAEVYDSGDGIDRATALANARLFAAAPDLLEALRSLLSASADAIRYVPADGSEERDLCDAAGDAMIFARAAIARAEGRGA